MFNFVQKTLVSAIYQNPFVKGNAIMRWNPIKMQTIHTWMNEHAMEKLLSVERRSWRDDGSGIPHTASVITIMSEKKVVGY